MWELLTNAKLLVFWLQCHWNHPPLSDSFPSSGSNSSTTLSGSSYPLLLTVGTCSLPLPQRTAGIISRSSRGINHRITDSQKRFSLEDIWKYLIQPPAQSRLKFKALSGCSRPCPVQSGKSPRMETLNLLSAPIPVLQSSGISLAATHESCLFSCHCALQRRVWLCSLSKLFLDSWR